RLHRDFGRDGREEADALLQRRSGDPNNPRILTAFNEKTSHWLAYYMFTFFTDRDGKFQLAALAESAFDPLARTTRFMLTEEAHHMFIGESGVANGEIVNRQVPALTALNARLRDDYIREIQAGVDRWNRIPEKFGIPFRTHLPHAGFHRKIGSFAGDCISPEGQVLSQEDWARK